MLYRLCSAVAQAGDMMSVVVSSADFVQVGVLCWCNSVKHYINLLLEVLYLNVEETKGECWCDSVKHYISHCGGD